MSRGEEQLREILQQEYPQFRIEEQVYIDYNGQRLFLDFYIPQLRLAFEVDGRQHSEYVPHFHKSRSNYYQALSRDVKKNDWASKNKIVLIRFSPRDAITVQSVRAKINGAVNE